MMMVAVQMLGRRRLGGASSYVYPGSLYTARLLLFEANYLHALQPVSSLITRKIKDELLRSLSQDASAHLHPGMFAALAELLLVPLPSVRRGYRERHGKPEDKSKKAEKEVVAGPRRLVTSVLIAMPSAHQRDRRRESSSHEHEEQGQLPELVLGISDEEVVWAHETLQDSLDQ